MLLEHAPDIVSKRDLIRRAWGTLVVDEVGLRVHVAALRRYLGDGGRQVLTSQTSRAGDIASLAK